MASSDDKKFPQASDGVRGLLNMDGTLPKPTNTQPEGSPPADLPFLETLEDPIITQQTQPEVPEKADGPLGGPAPAGHTGPIDQFTVATERKGSEFLKFGLNIVKTVLPYVAIFVIGLGLYSFYFSDFSFRSLFNSDRLKLEDVAEKNRNKDLDALKKSSQTDYDNWMRQFFSEVNEGSIISMDTDVSGNGLTNFEKYLLNLNPKVYSTRGNASDGQSVLDGVNPWTGKAFTDDQKSLIEKYINKELVSNRITVAALTRGVTKYAQYVNDDSPYYIDPNTLREIQRDNPVIAAPGHSVSPGYIPEITLPSQNNVQSSSSNNGNGSIGGNSPVPALNSGNRINESKPGRLEVPANKISVPLVWTQDPKNFDNDLKQGIVHYPGTAMPGETGTSYISGHSSGYLWDNSPYKQIFAILGQVKDGTSFTITVELNNGQKVRYHYVVQRRGEFAANDQSQFVSTADSVVALSTCWPVGTTDRRLVLFSKLTQTENNI